MSKIFVVGILGIIAIVVAAAIFSEDQPADNNTGIVNPPTATVNVQVENQTQNQSSSNPEQSSSNVSVASYEIVAEELIEPPNQRDRWVVRVQMDANQGDESIALGIAEAVRDAEASYGGATVYIVFASSGFDVDGSADVGRGYSSRDGLGMAGDGVGLLGEDEEGTIKVDVGSEVYTFEN